MTIVALRFRLLGLFLFAARIVHGNEETNYAGYVTKTDVESWANLARDVGAMKDAEGIEKKKEIYLKGKNSNYTLANQTVVTRSLASLSLNAYDIMKDDPMYSFFRYGFRELGGVVEGEAWGKFDNSPVTEYANTVVLDLFKLNATHNIQAEAAIIMNVWMMVVHQLTEVLRACKKDDTAQMNAALDLAVALWVGADHSKGSDDGNLLYDLAQQAGKEFAQITDGEAKVNTEIIKRFIGLQESIEVGTCAAGYSKLRFNVRKIIGIMTVPLMQKMIEYIFEPNVSGKPNFIELYALAMIPRVEACDPTAYAGMLDMFVKNAFQEDRRESAIAILESAYSCLEITCSEVGIYKSEELQDCDEVHPNPPNDLAGYSPMTLVDGYAKIDRDIMQIGILLQAGAYESAREYYEWGYNAIDGEGEAISLRDLATSPNRTIVEAQFSLFSEFYGKNDDYSSTMMDNILARAPPYDGASGIQLAELATGTLTYIVTYMAVLEKLYKAVAVCKDDTEEATIMSAMSWDRGAAFYIGSIEGTEAGGHDGGQSLYATSKKLCQFFGSCEENDGSQVNALIVTDLIAGADLLSRRECLEAEELLLQNILPVLPIPLIQGTLRNAVLNEYLPAETSEASFGAGHAFSRSILPLISAASLESAKVVGDEMEFQLSDDPVPNGASAVFEAIAEALKEMDVNCSNVGVYVDPEEPDVTYGVCPGDGPLAPSNGTSPVTTTSAPLTPAPVPAPTSTSETPSTSTTPPSPAPAFFESTIGFGRYTFKSDVTEIAAIALDVRDIMASETVENGKSIYMNGEHSQRKKPDGTGTIVSLADLSTTAFTYMKEDPMFNIYRWALFGEEFFDSVSAEKVDRDSAYADDAVLEAFNVTRNVALAAETAVVLNVWMEITHDLNDAIRECEEGVASAEKGIDRAVALWIGADQEEGDYDSGYLLYAIAQDAAFKLGQEEKESKVNTKLLELLGRAQDVAAMCPDASLTKEKFLELREIVADILKYMTIPFVQLLMYYIDKLDENLIELYTFAVVPQAAACGESIYEILAEHLDTEVAFNEAMVDDEFEKAMRSFLQCIRITCQDITEGMNPPSSLQDLISRLCYDPSAPQTKWLAGFEPTSDVSEVARFDLDILQIGILLETGARASAIDHYANGYNSRVNGRFQSLHALARSASRGIVEEYQLFSSYFESPNYDDDIIIGIMTRQGKFENATDDQLAEATLRTLQCMVTYMAILEKLYTGVERCREEDGQGSLEWEQAVALFVGSIEGSERGGREEGDGTMLFGLANELCRDFETCEGNDGASINEVLLSVFQDGRNMLADRDCDGAESLIKEDVLGGLLVPMIQGTLFYAVLNVDLDIETDSMDLASGAAITDAILPLVKQINTTSEAILSTNMDFDRENKPVKDGYEVVYAAVQAVLPGLGIDCDELGVFENITLDICDSGPDLPTDLANGTYKTTTFVEDMANISKDIVAIQNALENGSVELAKLIYEKGANSDIFDENGKKTGQRSFGEFSTNDALLMKQQPIFSIFNSAYQNSQGQYQGDLARYYANTIVENLFKSSDSNVRKLAPEGMIILNLWMYIVDGLYQTLDKCKQKRLTNNDGVHSIDLAAARWIGQGQTPGSGEKGHLLYALSERLGEQFGTENFGQTVVNRNILQLFFQANLELSDPNACAENGNTYPRLRQLVNQIVSQMIVPLVQGLINSLWQHEQERVRLYAHAFVPLTSACDPALFTFLRDKLMALTYNIVEVGNIVDRIRSSYACLGILCEDVGKHPMDSNDCLDTPELSPLAGYKPSTDVRAFASLDLDILEASILMKSGAYEAVLDLYRYGKHSVVTGFNGQETLSLWRLATTSERTTVPMYESFTRYFDDDNYVDSLIRRALDKDDFSGASPAQRTELVAKTMQTSLLHMAALQAMYDAVADCNSQESQKLTAAVESWDRAAALLIGSMEGSEDGGGLYGQSFFGLAKKRCIQFGTCNGIGNAQVNDELITKLYTGRGEVQAGSCSALRRAVDELEPLLLIPLIQGTLRYALENEKLQAGTQEGGLAEGYVFARSLLPLVKDSNQNSESTLSANMGFQLTSKPVQDGASAVFVALANVYSEMDVDCRLVGGAGGIDACSGAPTSRSGGNLGLIFGILIALVLVVVVVTFIYYRRRRAALREGSPSFVASKSGELNHDSDLLGGKYNDRYNDADPLYQEPMNGHDKEQAPIM